MKKITLIFLSITFFICFSTALRASHGLPLVGMSYTIGATGVTVSASSDAATCGSGPFWMQTKVSCSPSVFANTPPDACIKTYLQNWTTAGVNYNSFPWYNALLNVPNYNIASSWPDDCLLEPYNTNFIPFSDLCPGGVYYFASREIVTGGAGSPGPFSAVVSFTVPGTPVPAVPGFITSNPVTSPSNPSCGGPVLLTFTPPQGCSPTKNIVPGCPTCDSIVWKDPSGIIAVNTLTVMVNPTATTTYTLAHESCSPVNSVGCGLPYNPNITVYVANTNALFTTSATTVCAGSSISFNAIAPSLIDIWSVSPTTSVSPSSGNGPNFSAVFDEVGSYVITHQSMNGSCMDIKTNTVTVTPGITSSILTGGGGCAGPSGFGTATVSVSSSTIGLTYSWAPSGGTSDTETNIPFNSTYTVTMSNGGCVITKTVQITNNPPPSITSFSVNPPLCNGDLNGTVAANLSGGNPPFSFTWTPTITQTTQTVTGVGMGTYSVFVLDNNGCSTASVVAVSEPSVLTLTTSSSATICSGNTATISATANGGTTGYTYSWTPGNLTGPSAVVSPSTTTQYSCTVNDANGCLVTQTIDISVGLPLTVSASSQSICASSGSVTLTPSITSVGNGGPYTYSWSNGATTSSISVAANTTPGVDNYTVTISDGCTAPSAISIFTVVTTTAPSVSSFDVIEPLCNGQLTGTVSVNLTGGSSPFNFTWTPTISQNTQTVTGVGAGTYSVFVLDGAGCTTSSVVNVSEPSVLTLTASLTSTICSGNTVTLTTTANGGTPAYSYSWNPGNLSGSLIVVSPTTTTQYTCSVTDLNGCVQTQTTSITTTPALLVSSTLSSICVGDSTILVPTITSAGNGGPYTYLWSNGATSQSILVYGTAPVNTNYSVTVSDGCSLPSASGIFTVSTNPLPTTNITADQLTGNAPLNVNFDDLGSGGSIFDWNFGNGSSSNAQQPPLQTYQSGGTYQVLYTSTSASGCIARDTLTIVVIDLFPEIIVPNVFTPNGDKANDLFAVRGINITTFECSVFNRWGKLVFSSSDVNNSWDGKINGSPAAEGTYFYMIKASGSVGEEIKNQGYVSLFR
jgi:gliding motility-associated-like protein